MNCFGTSLKGFVDLFWGPKRANVSLDGLPKWSKRADIAIFSDFENMHFTFFCSLHLAWQQASNMRNAREKDIAGAGISL